jgi:hypothetical protein
MKKILVGIVLSIILPTVAWATPISVSLEASSNSVFVGDIFTIDILADIPDPVLGWGLDLNFDYGLVSQSAPPLVGTSWLPLFSTMDGDGLAGVTFPVPVSGANVLLASLTFEASAAGFATFAAGYTPLDLTEGFPLVEPGSFADVSFTNTIVTINSVDIPEPKPLLLFGVGLAVLAMTRWRNNHS